MERATDILGLNAKDVMTRNPVSVARTTLAAEALELMEQRKITSIVVADGDHPKRVAGVVHLHDLW
jgi:arabinose-5-phosphate isomerase